MLQLHFVPKKPWIKKEFEAMEDMLHIQHEDELLGKMGQNDFSRIFDTTYKLICIKSVASKQAQLNTHQKADLFKLLQ